MDGIEDLKVALVDVLREAEALTGDAAKVLIEFVNES